MSTERLQSEYYASTAAKYDAMHMADGDEHELALALFSGLITTVGGSSVLDVGSGTGRALRSLGQLNPSLRLQGVEPVAALREVAYSKGVPREMLVGGDGENLEFADDSFDWVCCFAVLHHVREPDALVREMLRVARVGVFISDSNNFGQGSRSARWVKGAARVTGLWPLVKWIRTRGKGYVISEGDGLFYPYSVFSSFELVNESCAKVMLWSTAPTGKSLLWSSPHLAVVGIK